MHGRHVATGNEAQLGCQVVVGDSARDDVVVAHVGLAGGYGQLHRLPGGVLDVQAAAVGRLLENVGLGRRQGGREGVLHKHGKAREAIPTVREATLVYPPSS